jgi:hypothetical protein
VTDDLRALALELDEVVKSVPGVSALFAADQALVRSAKQLTTRKKSLPLTKVTRSGNAYAVTVSVGISSDKRAPDAAAAVASAVRAALPWPNAEVLVRVSRIAH